MKHLASGNSAATAVQLTAALLVAAGTPAYGEDARSILETARAKQLERWEGVDSYVVRQSVMGQSVETRYQRAEVKDDSGDVQVMYLPVQGELQQCGALQMTPEALEAYAAASRMTGDGTAREIERGMADAGLPPELLAGSGSDPTATFDPRVMMGGNAEFLEAAAEAQRQQAAEAGQAEAAALESANHMAEFMHRAQVVGTETIDGRDAWHLRAEGLNRVQAADGNEYRMNDVSMWIDSDEFVPLRMKVDGTMTSAGETKPMTIESEQSDYRRVPGSNMYESYRQVMSISGMLNAEQEAQMREAQVQMADFEKQLAEMPDDQRQMMENMMGPQLDAMRTMAAGGGFRSEIAVDSIVVNPPTATAGGTPCPTTATAATAATATTATVAATAAPAPAAAPDPEALRAAQQACLQRKVEEAQKKQKKARGIGSLLSGVSRVAGRLGSDVGRDISETTRDVYDVNATANDFSRAAEDLGLTEDDIAACQNPL